ncbi:hypothetical protein [Flavobacterium suncheonense]|uniref:Lipoprotein n=1 Tax=Flavobacterium suncheonense GH29-5 = DSM 17707 TaxID=1121899 RepID=A0A0A2MC34_9FLAO|nr:hypothetical protein [Flavobacterium suncheonense]KGO89156.1 hypothetical protein Q764_08775 [Flavobacterium suncheonense GH29-5 = DSM 17707]
MKTTTTVILALFALLTLYSCTADDIETPSFKKETEMNANPNFSDFMTKRDSVSKEGEETDPPTKPPVRP